MRRPLLLCATVVLLFALAGCSDDGGDEDVATDDSTADAGSTAGSGAGSDSFCADAEANLALLEGDSEELPDDEALEQLEQLASAAPPEVQDDFATAQEGFEQLAELDESDPSSIEGAFDVLFDQEFIGAVDQIGSYLEEECGFEVESPVDSGLDDDPSGGDEDEGGVDSSTTRGYLESEAPEVEERVQSIASVSGVELTVGVRELTDPAEGVEICEVLSDFVYAQDGAEDTTIKVQDTETTDVAVRDGEDGTCEAA